MSPIEPLPDLPTTAGDAVQWVGQNGGFRFTRSDPDVWVVHRRGDQTWVGRLERHGGLYDFSTTGGKPGTIAISAIGMHLTEVVTDLL